MVALSTILESIKDEDTKKTLSKNTEQSLSERLGGEKGISQPNEERVSTFLGPMSRKYQEERLKEFPDKFMRQAAAGMLMQPVSMASGAIAPSLESTASQMIPAGVKGAISKLPGPLKGLAEYAGKTLTGTGVAASQMEEPKEHLGEAAIISSLVNALPFALKGIGGIAEYLNPKKFTEEAVGGMVKGAKSASEEASKQYEPIKKIFGNYNIMGRGHPERPIESVLEDKSVAKTVKRYAPELYEKFINKPSYSNAHNLQSQLFTEIDSLDPSDATNRHVIKVLGKARSALRETIFDFLKQRRPEFAEMYQKGTDITRDVLKPYEATKLLSKSKEGPYEVLKMPEPKELEKSILSAIKKDKIPKSHPLYELSKELSDKIKTGKTLGKLSHLASMAGAGSLLGGAVAPGIGHAGGGIMGLLGGLASPHHYGNVPYELAQNPKVIELLKKIYPGYHAGLMAASPVLEKGIGK